MLLSNWRYTTAKFSELQSPWIQILNDVQSVFKLCFCEISFTFCEISFTNLDTFWPKKAPSEVLSSKTTSWLSCWNLQVNLDFQGGERLPSLRDTSATKLVLVWSFSSVTAILHCRYSKSEEDLTRCKQLALQTVHNTNPIAELNTDPFSTVNCAVHLTVHLALETTRFNGPSCKPGDYQNFFVPLTSNKFLQII